ncbi:MAG: Cell division ATP-binding protein FtsE [Candidatus Woesebacteria bacterium GW2011_GWA1_39_21]|uniref:Cell division ATP-binding protein FtsE n=1 Tax=Candidatus Woesebacteria bacterium GW2011_GWA1_39_21 TaxID=1618550 RepID=A0A0G0QJW7_9BACT|nr:MAG: Cell division ATP-binding protein FtsE [Candidatus Woesebacteria bacterium GW2011_GWA1_39_21]
MLKLDKVTKVFGDIIAVDDISFDVSDGEFVFITGPSGSGKSTIIKLILRQIIPDSGEIILDGTNLASLKNKEIPKIRQKMGIVFQDFKMINERTLRENIEITLAVNKVPKNEWNDRVMHIAKLVGLEKRMDLFPVQLAGGELQRGALARALVGNPFLILADEPTGNLDWKTADEIMELFEKINNEGKTILMASHHLGIIEKHKKRVIELREGKVVADSAVTSGHSGKNDEKKSAKKEPAKPEDGKDLKKQ